MSRADIFAFGSSDTKCYAVNSQRLIALKFKQDEAEIKKISQVINDVATAVFEQTNRKTAGAFRVRAISRLLNLPYNYGM